MKIFILGFMGNGKTTVGRRLSQVLGYKFIDLDEEIEKECDLTVEEIFFLHGEQFFRQKEREQLLKVCRVDHAVIAVGGGTPCFYDNMDLMNKEGYTVYLKLSADAILNRILAMSEDAIQSRPLISNKSEEELKTFIHDALKKREPFYAQAKIIVDNQHNKIEQTIQAIRNQLPVLS